MESYPYPVKEGYSDILTSTLTAILFSSHPKKGKGSRGSFKLLR